jgi:hypothetical protein
MMIKEEIPLSFHVLTLKLQSVTLVRAKGEKQDTRELKKCILPPVSVSWQERRVVDKQQIN